MGNYTYTRDEEALKRKPAAKPGNYRICIVDVQDKQSKSGNDMIVVSYRLSGTETTVNDYFVKGEYFNSKMTKFFAAFPSIKEGSFVFPEWFGAMSGAHFVVDEVSGYLRFKYFLAPDEIMRLPEWEGPRPVQQTIQQLQESATDENGEFVPF